MPAPRRRPGPTHLGIRETPAGHVPRRRQHPRDCAPHRPVGAGHGVRGGRQRRQRSGKRDPGGGGAAGAVVGRWGGGGARRRLDVWPSALACHSKTPTPTAPQDVACVVVGVPKSIDNDILLIDKVGCLGVAAGAGIPSPGACSLARSALGLPCTTHSRRVSPLRSASVLTPRWRRRSTPCWPPRWACREQDAGVQLLAQRCVLRRLRCCAVPLNRNQTDTAGGGHQRLPRARHRQADGAQQRVHRHAGLHGQRRCGRLPHPGGGRRSITDAASWEGVCVCKTPSRLSRRALPALGLPSVFSPGLSLPGQAPPR